MVVLTFETISYVSMEMQWVYWGPDVQYWGMSNTKRRYKVDFDFVYEARAWAYRRVDMLPRDAWHKSFLFSSISLSLSLSLSLYVSLPLSPSLCLSPISSPLSLSRLA